MPAGLSCTDALVAFEKKYDVIVAFDPSLSGLLNQSKRTIQGFSKSELFEKICRIYQLEYVIQDHDKFLVRSGYNEIQSREYMLAHIRVKEPDEGTSIPYAAVYDETGNVAGFTDEFGDCFIKIPMKVAGQKWVIHALGHKDVTIVPDTNQFFQVTLPFNPVVSLPVFIKTYKNALSLNSSQAFDIQADLLQKLAGRSMFYNDVIRTVQLFPGISNTSDHRTSIRIRGSGEEATMLVLDHMPIYKADHYFGVFGAFNSQYISQAQIYKNNIPVAFGGRTAGLALFNSDTVMAHKNISLDLHLIGAGVAVQLPVGKSLQVKIAARKTYMDIANQGLADLSERDNVETQLPDKEPVNTVVSQPSHNFDDFNAQIRYKKKDFSIEANTFLSTDRYLDSYMDTFFGRFKTINQERYTQENNWKNSAFGLVISKKSGSHQFQGSMYSTSWSADYAINSILSRKIGPSAINDTVLLNNYNFIYDRGGKIEWSLPAPKKVKLGLEHIHHQNEIYMENSRSPLFEINKSGSETSLYANTSSGSKTSLLIEPGIRMTYLYNLNKFLVLPQLYASYNLNDNNLLKISAGRHMQYVRMLDHENVIGQRQQFFALSNNTSIPLGIGVNFMTGYAYSSGNFRIDMEGYFRNLNGAIYHATRVPGLRPAGGNINAQEFVLFSGNSRTFGSDLTMVYEDGRHFSMLTYTLSKSENSFKRIFDGQYFPSPEDSRHQLKWVHTYTLDNMDVSMTYSGATGRPYLDLSGLKDGFEREEINLNDYIRNLKHYHRIDAGAGYTFHIKGIKSRVGISVFNLLNRVNTLNRQFLFQIPGVPGQPGNTSNTILGSEVSQLERTWNLSLQFFLQNFK